MKPFCELPQRRNRCLRHGNGKRASGTSHKWGQLTTWCSIRRPSALVPPALDLWMCSKRRLLIITGPSDRSPLDRARGTDVWSQNSKGILLLYPSTKGPTPKSWSTTSSEKIFSSQKEAQIVIKSWRAEYNARRSRSHHEAFESFDGPLHSVRSEPWYPYVLSSPDVVADCVDSGSSGRGTKNRKHHLAGRRPRADSCSQTRCRGSASPSIVSALLEPARSPSM